MSFTRIAYRGRGESQQVGSFDNLEDIFPEVKRETRETLGDLASSTFKILQRKRRLPAPENGRVDLIGDCLATSDELFELLRVTHILCLCGRVLIVDGPVPPTLVIVNYPDDPHALAQLDAEYFYAEARQAAEHESSFFPAAPTEK